MSKLSFLIGLPRSGKSTYSRKWSEQKPGRVVVNSDSIRLALHGNRYCPLAETMVFAIKHVIIRAHLHNGYEVLVDGTHTTDISMKRLLEIDTNAKPILIQTPKELCIERALATNQPDLVPVINKINGNLNMLLAEGVHNRIARLKLEIAAGILH